MSDKIRIELLEAHHIAQLLPRIQELQAEIADAMRSDPFLVTLMRKAGPALAFISGNQVIAAAGLVDFPGTGRAHLWCIFASEIAGEFRGLFSLLMRLREFYPRRRYEAHISPDWPEAQRLVKAAGFVREGVMKSFNPDGSDKELWAFIKEDAA